MASENCRALLLRVKEATSAEALRRIEKSAERVYNAGCLTPDEFAKIDGAIVDKEIAMSEELPDASTGDDQ